MKCKYILCCIFIKYVVIYYIERLDGDNMSNIIKKVSDSILNTFNTDKFHLNNYSKKENSYDSIDKVSVDEISFTDNIDNTLGDLDYQEIMNDGFRVQGYTTYDGKTYISAYNHDGENSRIYVYDDNGLSNVIILDNKAHVGGISIDNNGILFVTNSKGLIDTYNLESLKEQFINNKTIDFSTGQFNNYKIDNNINTLEDEATIYCYDGKLYTATYGFKGTIKEIEYSFKDGRINATSKVLSNNIASVIQGIALYKNDNGDEYLVTASSSKNIGSRIRIYKKDGNNLERVASFNSNIEGLEGISIDNNGNITGICEYKEQNVRDLGNVDDYVNIVSNSHINFKNNSILFALSGLVWDLKH